MTSQGLLLGDTPGLLDFQEPYTRSRDEVSSWAGGDAAGQIGLADVVAHAHPTMLIGTSTHSGAFTEAIVKDMAAHTDRPIIMPLSNPTSKCRGAARGPHRVDQRPGPDGHRQPLPAGRS